ncbi:Alpha/Beta hydrolase protein [Lipomyces tetrasporus]|uniref:Alpha/Beta hydrolase protein n=1 Tax=Lipomyces tetrasporus TaxID=54092 RepID=A0AAD7VWP2_9ASCO|nr:Alpha/Beta hydrolase protein [Lipomyces tetrasporus]KAJ8104426.1 Alpha/Beta hydrolase protein [Lipomyces tetrasporus]
MASLFPRFDRITLVYKRLRGTDFLAAALIPKSLSTEEKMSCPVLVHFHGGALINGTLEPAYLAQWPLELAESKGAIIVSPEYRLMPEANGAHILEDIKDFWAWVHKTLPIAISGLNPNLTLDLDRIATVGESASGYLAMQSGFLFPEAKVRVIMAQNCAMYPDVRMYNSHPTDPLEKENAFVDAYLKQLKPGAMRLSTPFPTMIDFALDYCLRTTKEIPPMWIAQGTEDHIMPKEATDEMVKKIKETRPEVPLLYSVQLGDHGFDMGHKLSEAWLAEAMAYVGKYWP